MKTKLTVIYALIFALGLQSCGLLSAAGISKQGLSAKEVPKDLNAAPIESTIKLDHSAWTALLKKYVDARGFVDYMGFKNDNTALQDYLSYLSSYGPDESWSVQEQLAFYINLYNAYTVKLILDNYPTQSIKDINGPWTKAFVPVGNTTISLGGIENSILRTMNEPRIHFAINCASVSCPKLLDEAYTAAKIDAQLERVTHEFINGERNQITANGAKVSQLFNWYAKDYKVKGIESVIEYINKYSKVKIPENATLEFLQYDWSLNEQ